MSLINRIDADIIVALKNRESEKVEVLRYLKSGLQNLGIAKRGELTDVEVEKQIASEIKRRNEAMVQFQAGGREDLAEKDKSAIEILKKYLPESLGEAEIEKIIRGIIAAVGASSAKDFGKVMGPVMAKIGTRADGKIVKAKVGELLS